MDFRREWLERLVAQCQTFVGSVITLGDTDELTVAASSWVDELPDPRCPAEDLALRAILIEVAVKWSAAIHTRAHWDVKRRCAFDPTHGLDRFGGNTRQTAKRCFEEWARAFSREFGRTHPRSPAQRAAAIVRIEAPTHMDVARLARLVGVTPARLRRMFQRERGLALPEHLRRVRLLCALEELVERGGKIEPIALEVGYRSKKNFYRVFRQLTGLTPTGFRHLPAATARQMVETMRLAVHARYVHHRRGRPAGDGLN